MDRLKVIIDKMEPLFPLGDISYKFYDEKYSGELLEVVNELKSQGFTKEQISEAGITYCVRKAKYYEKKGVLADFISAANFIGSMMALTFTASICEFKFVNRMGYGRPVSVPFCQYTERGDKIILLEGGNPDKVRIIEGGAKLGREL